MNELGQLFKKHGTDKHWRHHYEDLYYDDFLPLKDKEINLLDIGTFRGNSVKAFLDFFPAATIYTIDDFVWAEQHKAQHVLNMDRVVWAVSNSREENAFPGVMFDIIIDDATHAYDANVETHDHYWPAMKQGGLYYIEDVKDEDTVKALLITLGGELALDNSGHRHPNSRIIKKVRD